MLFFISPETRLQIIFEIFLNQIILKCMFPIQYITFDVFDE